jgi:hypothetical protein
MGRQKKNISAKKMISGANRRLGGDRSVVSKGVGIFNPGLLNIAVK